MNSSDLVRQISALNRKDPSTKPVPKKKQYDNSDYIEGTICDKCGNRGHAGVHCKKVTYTQREHRLTNRSKRVSSPLLALPRHVDENTHVPTSSFRAQTQSIAPMSHVNTRRASQTINMSQPEAS